MTDGDHTTECRMRGCERIATGDYTRTMWSSSEGDEYPEDVRPQPICWFHYAIDRGMEAGMGGLFFGLAIGTIAWWNGADAAVYVFYGLAVAAGFALSYAVKAIRARQVFPHD